MAYLVDLSRTAEAEVLEAFIWKSKRSPAAASRWYGGLREALTSLEENPKRCALAPEDAVFTEDVHQLLYGKRSDAYRILFTLRGVIVYVLHVRHGSQQPLFQPAEEKDEN